MGRYRKRPVVIEARQTGQTYEDDCSILAWCNGIIPHPDLIEGTHILFGIETLEGVMNVNSGDWVICGVQGEFYPCKPDIFDATYEQDVSSAEGSA